MENVGLVDLRFWQGRRVFITGHTGFKGAWLSLWLTHMGAQVTGFALPPPTKPSLFDLAHVAKGITSLTGDIRNFDVLKKAVDKATPELVIHMAAQALVRPSYADPLGTYAANVMGTAHILEASRHCPEVRAVLVITSDKCYENTENAISYSEQDPMGGYDPYSSSKGCAELVTAAYRTSYFHPKNYSQHGVAIASARAGNVIGGGDWAQDRLIPDAMRAFGAGALLKIRNPKSVRPWQHVLDPLNGYLQLCQQLLGKSAPKFAEGWNFGPAPESEQKVENVIGTLAAQWGDGAKWQDDSDPTGPHEAHYLSLNCAKARENLRWKPVYDLEQALALTCRWYKSHQDKEDMRALTLRQIEDMMKSH